MFGTECAMVERMYVSLDLQSVLNIWSYNVFVAASLKMFEQIVVFQI